MSKRRTYRYLGWGTRDLYRFTVVTLFCVGLFRFLSSPKDAHWTLLVGSCVGTADNTWAQGEIEEDGTWRLEMVGHFIFTYKPRNAFEERVLLFFFRQFRTPESTSKRPFLRQEWLAEWFGVYQESISRWQKYVGEGGSNKLDGEHDGWVVTPEVRQAIMDIWPSNFWSSAAQVRERLLAVGHISSLEDISESSIHRVAQETGFAEVRRLLREMFKFTADDPEWRDDVLIDRVFELNERLMALLQEREGLTPRLTLEVESLKQALGAPIILLKKALPYAYCLRQAPFDRLRAGFFGQWEEIHDGSVRCPHCGSDLVNRKDNKPRCKKYRDPETGEWCKVEGYRYYCRNLDCEHETFTNYQGCSVLTQNARAPVPGAAHATA